MLVAYGWAFLNPLRKMYYNLTVTVISVLVALAIGTLELLQVIASEFNRIDPFWGRLANLDFEIIGFGIMIIFLVSWLVSVVVWKYGRFDKIYSRRTSSV